MSLKGDVFRISLADLLLFMELLVGVLEPNRKCQNEREYKLEALRV